MNQPNHSRNNQNRNGQHGNGQHGNGQHGNGQRRRPPAKKPTVDIWRCPAPMPEPEKIVIPDEVGALLRSLGEPPMIKGGIAFGYFSTVIERAAAVAVAIAFAADVLADADVD
jgi:hypothetical protein